MKFCVHCGQPLIRIWIEADRVERSFCSACRQAHYENPKILVWCFAHWHDHLLLCRRALDPARGLWNPPSGFVEMGESLEEAAAREMAEETGLIVPPSAMRLYRIASIPHMNEVYVGFRTELVEEPLVAPGPEALEARLWSEADFPVSEFAFRDLLHDVPEDFFRCMRRREFPVLTVTIRRPAATSAAADHRP